MEKDFILIVIYCVTVVFLLAYIIYLIRQSNTIIECKEKQRKIWEDFAAKCCNQLNDFEKQLWDKYRIEVIYKDEEHNDKTIH